MTINPGSGLRCISRLQDIWRDRSPNGDEGSTEYGRVCVKHAPPGKKPETVRLFARKSRDGLIGASTIPGAQLYDLRGLNTGPLGPGEWTFECEHSHVLPDSYTGHDAKDADSPNGSPLIFYSASSAEGLIPNVNTVTLEHDVRMWNENGSRGRYPMIQPVPQLPLLHPGPQLVKPYCFDMVNKAGTGIELDWPVIGGANGGALIVIGSRMIITVKDASSPVDAWLWGMGFKGVPGA
jgi:hypothetical protein